MAKEFFHAGGNREHPNSLNRILQTARRLGLQIANLETGQERPFLALHNRLSDLLSDIQGARASIGTPVQGSFTPPGGESGPAVNLTPDMAAQLSINYERTSPYLAFAQLLIEERLGVRTISTEDIQAILNPALEGRGIYIAPHEAPEFFPAIVYDFAVDADSERGEESQRQIAEGYGLTSMSFARVNNSDPVRPDDTWLYAPAMWEYVGITNGLVEAEDDIENARSDLGYERRVLRSVNGVALFDLAHVVRLAHFALEDGVDGANQPTLELMLKLNEPLKRRRLHAAAIRAHVMKIAGDHETDEHTKRRLQLLREQGGNI